MMPLHYTSTKLKWDGAILSKNQNKIPKADVTYIKKATILLFSEGEITWNQMLLKTKHIQSDS